MNDEGPSLTSLTRRIAECPEEFLEIAAGPNGSQGTVALIADWLRTQTPEPLSWGDDPFLARLHTIRRESHGARYLALLNLCVWLLYDEWFQSQSPNRSHARTVLEDRKLVQLAELVKPQQVVADPDRREEFVRLCLASLNLRPLGESIPQATDRLATLDSVERSRILKETAAAERRAREIREAMARARAQESASRYGE